MSTFSEIVDELMVELVRPDFKALITDYLNLTIRESHQKKTNADVVPVLYESNRVEDSVTITSLPAVWDIPNIARFQYFETAYYPASGRYALKRHVTRTMEKGNNPLDPFWYRAGGYFVFNGVNVGEDVKLTYFQYPARLKYYAVATPQIRPAVYDFEADVYTYATAYDVDATTRANARAIVTNWLLLNHAEVMKQGVRAKVWARLGESDRAKMAFSLYESLRLGLIGSEINELNQ